MGARCSRDAFSATDMNVLVDGAQLQCSLGTKLSRLTVPPKQHVTAGSVPAATKDDIVPGTNIAPFGACSALSGPCVPVIAAPWSSPGSEVLINGLRVLNDASTCVCANGGNIAVADAKQSDVSIGESTASPLRRAGQDNNAQSDVAQAQAAKAPLDAYTPEGSVTLRISLRDEYERPMPGAPYRLRIGNATRQGTADGSGLLEEHNVSLEGECFLEWGPPAGDSSSQTHRFAQTLRSGDGG